jgi:hypothetical protein
VTSWWSDGWPASTARGVSPGVADRGPRRCPAPSAEVREAVMDRIMIAMAIGMGLVFGTGVIVGVIAMVAMAIRREDKRGSLTQPPPDVLARGARRLNGVGLRNITPRDAGGMR